jgi:hypothetical protein
MTRHDVTVATPSDVTSRERQNRSLAEQLVEQARAGGKTLVGPGGLPSDLTKQVLETGLVVGDGGASRPSTPCASPPTPKPGTNRRSGAATDRMILYATVACEPRPYRAFGAHGGREPPGALRPTEPSFCRGWE